MQTLSSLKDAQSLSGLSYLFILVELRNMQGTTFVCMGGIVEVLTLLSPILGFQLGIDPAKSLHQLFSGPIHGGPTMLSPFEVCRQVAIHMFAPEFPGMWIRLSVLKTLWRKRGLPRSHWLQMPNRWILNLRQIHCPRRLPLLMPRVGFVYRHEAISVRVKIVEVVCWQSSSLPVIQSYSSVSIANEIQLVIGSFEVGRVGTVPNIHCIYQVISWETSFLGRIQPTFQWGTLSNCKLCPHQHESFKSIAKSHHCQQKQSHMAHKTSRQMSEGQSGSQNCNYLWCTTYLPTNSRSTWKPSDVIETGHTGCEVCSCKYWKVEAWKGMNKLPALINFLP